MTAKCRPARAPHAVQAAVGAVRLAQREQRAHVAFVGVEALLGALSHGLEVGLQPVLQSGAALEDGPPPELHPSQRGERVVRVVLDPARQETLGTRRIPAEQCVQTLLGQSGFWRVRVQETGSVDTRGRQDDEDPEADPSPEAQHVGV